MDRVRLSQLHAAYLRELAALGKSPGTRTAYRSDFLILQTFLGGDDVRALTSARCREYPIWLAQRPADRTRGAKGHSPRGIIRRVASASAFCKWLVARGDLKTNPFEGVQRPKVPKRVRRALPPEWVQAMLDLPDVPPRDAAILRMLRYQALRIEEVSNLDLDCLGPDTMRVLGKGDKERVLPLHHAVKEALIPWLEVRPPGHGPLFTSHKSERLGTKGVYRVVKHLAYRASLPPFTPHQLRHTCAFALLQDGMHISDLQLFMGHESLETTAIYTVADAASLRESCQRVWARQEEGATRANS